jgi:5,10-methylenetetrahydromethanopterin reductase
VKLGLGFNPVMPVREVAKVAVRAEQEEYDSIWMHESLYQRDVVSYLSAIVASTTKLRASSGAINTFTRHPVTTATTFATLSELSGGRVTLGLGLGSFPTIPLIGHKIFPVKETHPLKRIKEYVEVVRKIWSGEKANFRGEFFTVENLQLGFKLEQKIPLFVASLSPRTLQFAGGAVDGAILSPSLNTIERTSEMVRQVRTGEQAKGRNVEKASYMLTSLDPDPRKARDVVKGFYFFVFQLSDVVNPQDLVSYGVTEERLRPMKDAWRKGNLDEAKSAVPEEAVDALTLAGTPDQAHERLREYGKTGVTLPIIMPIGNIDYAISSMSPRLNAHAS